VIEEAMTHWGGCYAKSKKKKKNKEKENFSSQRNVTVSQKSIFLLSLVMETQCVFCEVCSGIVYYLNDFQAYSEIEMRSPKAPFVM
jgi:hypothetical protein